MRLGSNIEWKLLNNTYLNIIYLWKLDFLSSEKNLGLNQLCVPRTPAPDFKMPGHLCELFIPITRSPVFTNNENLLVWNK